MSEDSGTYVLMLKDGFRVAQLHAAENLLKDVNYVVSAYAEKLVWITDEKALNYALTLEMERLTEYGVWYIKDYKNLTWTELLECASLGLRSTPRATALGATERNRSLSSEIMTTRKNN